MARLSVNLNKVALLRNSRRTGVPDVMHFARLAHDAGADGITVHPRPDERHIRADDVRALARLMQPWRPAFELNIEGYPEERLLALVREAGSEQCTLVPDAADVFTSEEGWKLDGGQMRLIRSTVSALEQTNCRVILFVDPDPEIIDRVGETGAGGIEIYTGSYAAAFRVGRHEDLLAQCAETARVAARRGLVVNAGHDLNLANIAALTAALPMLAEASIGHELTADALVMGLAAAIGKYKRALDGTRQPST
jgi:pyridoxine 5-phosphate synthase